MPRRPNLWPRLVVPLLIFFSVAGLAALLWWDSTRLTTAESLIGTRAPLDHPLIGRGAPVLVNFWFSSCAPCRAEHPVLMNVAAEGLAILGVNRDVSPQDAQAFLQTLGNPFQAQIADPSDQIAAGFGIKAWPTSVLVAGNGLIQATYGPLIDPGARADMALVAQPETLFADPEQEARAQRLFALINCLDCEANSVQESGGDFAIQMRKLVRAWLTEGRDEAAIRQALVARYGPRIWLDPPFNWTTAPLYLLPFLLIAGGGGWLWWRGQGQGRGA